MNFARVWGGRCGGAQRPADTPTAAPACAQLCLVGSRAFNTFGSHGADVHVALAHFPTLEACVEELRGRRGCEVVGVEIMPGAAPVHAFPFRGPTAFLLGNEGQGLNDKQLRLCDSFIYIPQYGCGTARWVGGRGARAPPPVCWCTRGAQPPARPPPPPAAA